MAQTSYDVILRSALSSAFGRSNIVPQMIMKMKPNEKEMNSEIDIRNTQCGASLSLPSPMVRLKKGLQIGNTIIEFPIFGHTDIELTDACAYDDDVLGIALNEG